MKDALLLMAVIPWVIAAVVTMIVFFSLRRRLAQDSIGHGASFSAVLGFVLCLAATLLLGNMLIYAFKYSSHQSGLGALYLTLLITVALPLFGGVVLTMSARMLARSPEQASRNAANMVRDLGLGGMPSVLADPFIAASLLG